MNESTLVPREEVSDLDWLARNVHVWACGDYPSWCYVITIGDGSKLASAVAFNEPAASMIEKADWLSRRAELQNKPSWKDAPEWAEWLGQDDDGAWFWYEKEPSRGGNQFRHASCFVCYAQAGEVLGDWRDTLEKRTDTEEIPSHSNQPKPSTNITECAEVKQFDPFVSVEDALREFDAAYQASKPGYAATAKQPKPKGSGNPILGMVLADLTNRALEGKEKYGEPLLAHNGRNPLWDAYQEALDLAMYLRQAIEEQKK